MYSLLTLREYTPGKIGIVSRSGTLCYETVASTTKAGLGQSVVVGIGGDRMPGTTYVDALQLFADDPATKGIILIGEIGGRSELDACDYIKETKLDEKKYETMRSHPDIRPILTYFAGLSAVPNYTMGHSGTIETVSVNERGH
jgi:succinyl-CoA synthetase alpha subunit